MCTKKRWVTNHRSRSSRCMSYVPDWEHCQSDWEDVSAKMEFFTNANILVLPRNMDVEQECHLDTKWLIFFIISRETINLPYLFQLTWKSFLHFLKSRGFLPEGTPELIHVILNTHLKVVSQNTLASAWLHVYEGLTSSCMVSLLYFDECVTTIQSCVTTVTLYLVPLPMSVSLRGHNLGSCEIVLSFCDSQPTVTGWGWVRFSLGSWVED